MTSYLRQIARQAAGERLPGQPRPLRMPEAMRLATTETDTQAAEHGIESFREEAEERGPASVVHQRAVASTGHDATILPESGNLEQPVEQTSPVRANRQPVAAPVLQPIRNEIKAETLPPAPRFDSIEALLPVIVNPRRKVLEPDAADSPHQRTASARSYDEPDRGSLREASGKPVSADRMAPSPTSRASRTAQTEPASFAAAAAPDVHIHIGRVELTALQAPAPRPAPRREEKKPMSLEEYLRQRDGRRS